jgi:hypothetical protein
MPTEDESKAVRYEPHPYALLLPPLTGEEYAALKADITEHGVLYPVILDGDGRVLDGVHRERIAAELGIDLPTATHAGLTDERKLHLAVGLNMRRRHLDADRRRALVRRLHGDEGLSLRKIASITGWSKSTIDRDLKTSPFEQAAETARQLAADSTRLKTGLASISDETARELAGAFGELVGSWASAFSNLYGWADQQWKRGNWPPPDSERMFMMLARWDAASGIRDIRAALDGKPVEERETKKRDDRPGWLCLASEIPPGKKGLGAPREGWAAWWLNLPADQQEHYIAQVKAGKSPGVLAIWDRLGVPEGTAPGQSDDQPG